jgi:general stress protein 26
MMMTKQDAISQGLELVDKSKMCLVGTNGDNGFPNIKAMFSLKHKGLKHVWFSTNTSSKRVKQLKRDNKVCLYYVDEKNYKGLMLIGTIKILQDLKSKKMLWSEGNEKYYPQGVTDPDYSVLYFTAESANYYHGMKNLIFKIGGRK